MQNDTLISQNNELKELLKIKNDPFGLNINNNSRIIKSTMNDSGLGLDNEIYKTPSSSQFKQTNYSLDIETYKTPSSSQFKQTNYSLDNEIFKTTSSSQNKRKIREERISEDEEGENDGANKEEVDDDDEEESDIKSTTEGEKYYTKYLNLIKSRIPPEFLDATLRKLKKVFKEEMDGIRGKNELI
jgi:hypothetical protein